jgi:polygalacturonase
MKPITILAIPGDPAKKSRRFLAHGDGLDGSPSIQKAVDYAGSGGTVHIPPGRLTIGWTVTGHGTTRIVAEEDA